MAELDAAVVKISTPAELDDLALWARIGYADAELIGAAERMADAYERGILREDDVRAVLDATRRRSDVRADYIRGC